MGALAFHCQEAEGNVSVTDLPAYWAKGPKKILTSPQTVSRICFRNAKRMFSQPTTKPKKELFLKKSSLPSKVNVETFLTSVKKTNPDCVILKVIPPFCNVKVETFPYVFTDLYKDQYSTLSVDSLMKMGRQLQFNLNAADIRKIEESTRLQSKNALWKKYRIGRITASKCRSVCRVRAADSNISLIKQICYSSETQIRKKEILWGCRHEKDALAAYLKINLQKHANLEVRIHL